MTSNDQEVSMEQGLGLLSLIHISIVINVGPGDFTDTGHFMVITGYDDEGFSINDPNSIAKSGKRWLFKNISSQIRAVWRMYV